MKTNKTIFTSLDLELNKEGDRTTDIIQIGAVVGNIYTGEILDSLCIDVRVESPINPFITQLTGITDAQNKIKGISLLEAYNKLKEIHLKHNSHPSLIQWGGGDDKTLKSQLNIPSEEWIFGHRCFDVKTICQSILLSKEGQNIQGGLKKNCNRFGVLFEGPAHNARQDALNTFRLFVALLKKIGILYL